MAGSCLIVVLIDDVIEAVDLIVAVVMEIYLVLLTVVLAESDHHHPIVGFVSVVIAPGNYSPVAVPRAVLALHHHHHVDLILAVVLLRQLLRPPGPGSDHSWHCRVLSSAGRPH